MQEKGLNTFRTVVFEVSSFVGNPVYHLNIKHYKILSAWHVKIKNEGRRREFHSFLIATVDFKNELK